MESGWWRESHSNSHVSPRLETLKVLPGSGALVQPSWLKWMKPSCLVLSPWNRLPGARQFAGRWRVRNLCSVEVILMRADQSPHLVSPRVFAQQVMCPPLRDSVRGSELTAAAGNWAKLRLPGSMVWSWAKAYI